LSVFSNYELLCPETLSPSDVLQKLAGIFGITTDFLMMGQREWELENSFSFPYFHTCHRYATIEAILAP